MKVLLLGAGGQLGRAIQACCPQDVSLKSFTRGELDIVDPAAVVAAIQEFQPDAVVNAAAYTAVDRAEQEREQAFAVNGCGPANIAAATAVCGAYLLHVSTDFVFDGLKSTPYRPEDRPAPLSVYGESKLAGERALAEVIGLRYCILRTAWVYAAAGHNFVNTMLRLLAERDEVRVISDQVGAPTWAGSLARAVWAATIQRAEGIFHWTDSGVASWYDFAVAISEEAAALGLVASPASIRPIATSDYPLPAKRPSYSVLDLDSTTSKLALDRIHWRVNLRHMLKELLDA